jgi:hypothetical protein
MQQKHSADITILAGCTGGPNPLINNQTIRAIAPTSSAALQNAFKKIFI